MRTEQEMMDLILGTARSDERIRAVWMNGSRLNSKAKRDLFQDYDIVYVVNNLGSFKQQSWVDRFGERIIMQTPESRFSDVPEAVVYLMQFKDGNRIDLTIVPSDQAPNILKEEESLTQVLLDKDGNLPEIPPPSDQDYHVKQPTNADFQACCNEFWWVSLYVAKGLWRDEVLYAKGILEGPLRHALIQMLDWHVGIKHQFEVSTGKFSKDLKHLLDPLTWNRLLETYPRADIQEVWQALYLMCELFHDMGRMNAEQLGFKYNEAEEQNVREYLNHIRKLPQDASSFQGK